MGLNISQMPHSKRIINIWPIQQIPGKALHRICLHSFWLRAHSVREALSPGVCQKAISINYLASSLPEKIPIDQNKSLNVKPKWKIRKIECSLAAFRSLNLLRGILKSTCMWELSTCVERPGIALISHLWVNVKFCTSWKQRLR